MASFPISSLARGMQEEGKLDKVLILIGSINMAVSRLKR